MRCVRCNKAVTLHGDAIYTDAGPLCDGCSGERRDSQGRLISVMDTYRRGWAMELALFAVVGIICGSLLFVTLKEMGLMPYFWRLIP